MPARTRYRFIGTGDPEEMEKRAVAIRDRFPFPAGWSDFVIRRVSGTKLTAVVIDDPSEELIQAFREDAWQYGGSV
jgi:hypothetical protein